MFRHANSALILSALTASLVFALASAFAQTESARSNEPTVAEQEEKGQSTEGQTPNRFTQKVVGASDAEIAASLLVDYRRGIAATKFLADRVRTPALKKYLQRVVDENQKSIPNLEESAAAGGYRFPAPFEQARGAQPNLETDRDTDTETDTEQGKTPNAIAAQQKEKTSTLNWIAIEHEIAARSVRSVQRRFEEEAGDNFDWQALSYEEQLHRQMVAALEVFQNQASAELRPLIETRLQTARSHLEDAVKLERTVEFETQR